MKLPDGHFNAEVEGVFLVSLIDEIKELEGQFVEIGSLFGKSSVIIGQKIKEIGGILNCIDVWGQCEYDLAEEIGDAIRFYPKRPKNSFEIFCNNIKRFELTEVINPIKMRSEFAFNTWSIPLKFVFVDGCHEYEFVKKDILWKRFLVPGGVMVFHDYHTPWKGVKKAVDELMNKDSAFKMLADCHTIKAFKRLDN